MSVSRSSLPASTRRITPMAVTSLEIDATRTGSSAVTARCVAVSAKPWVWTEVTPVRSKAMRTLAIGWPAAATRVAASNSPSMQIADTRHFMILFIAVSLHQAGCCDGPAWQPGLRRSVAGRATRADGSWLFGIAALDLADQVVEDARVLGIQGVAAHAAEMVVERAHHALRIVQRIADRGQRHPWIKAGRRIGQGGERIGPQAEAIGGECRPRKQRAGIDLARGRHG